MKWGIEVGDGYGIGSVSDGRFFQLDAERQFDVVTSRQVSRERLRCFDFVSGQELWSKVRLSTATCWVTKMGHEQAPLWWVIVSLPLA